MSHLFKRGDRVQCVRSNAPTNVGRFGTVVRHDFIGDEVLVRGDVPWDTPNGGTEVLRDFPVNRLRLVQAYLEDAA